MDSGKLWGWGRLFNPDGTFRTGRTILNAFLHALIAFGCALLPTALYAWLATSGPMACVWIGAAVGTVGMLTREAVQWISSGSPHLLDRLLDLIPAPVGGAAGGLAAWLIVSRFLS